MFFPLMKKRGEREKKKCDHLPPFASICPSWPFIIGFATKRESSGRSLIRFAASRIARGALFIYY